MSDTPREQLDYRTIFGPDTWDAAMSSLPSSREQAMVINFLDQLSIREVGWRSYAEGGHYYFGKRATGVPDDAVPIYILTPTTMTDTTD